MKFKELLQDGISKYIPVIKSDSWRKKSNWKYPINKDVQAFILKKA